MGGRRPFLLDKESYTTTQRHTIVQTFARQLLADGYRESTVDGYLDQVIGVHREILEYEIVGERRSWRRWRRRLRAAGRRAPNRARAAPAELLRAARRRCRRGRIGKGTFAAMVVAWFGCLRRCEYTAASGRTTRPLQFCWRRVVFFDRKMRQVKWSSSRVHGCCIKVYRKHAFSGGAGQWLPLFRTGDSDVCPVGVLLELARESGAPADGPVFTEKGGKYVSGASVNAAVKACAVDIGMAPRHMSTHSLRRGGSVALDAGGFGSEFRKMFAAWNSETHQVYRDPLPRLCTDVAKGMWRAKVETVGLRH